MRISPSFCHQEPLPDDEVEQRELYEVYALVYIIEQPDVGRHLVSCIKVSEPYHQRKERVTCTQWYLFNDFCIEPIEKVHKQICDEKSNVTVEPLFQSHPEKLGKGGRNRKGGGGGGRMVRGAVTWELGTARFHSKNGLNFRSKCKRRKKRPVINC